MKVIGITGTIGAGKGTIVEYLQKEYGYLHFSVRGYLTEMITARGLPLNRDTMVAVANELREKNSPSFIAEELYRKAQSADRNCIVESIRTVGEVKALREKGNFYLFAVDAAPKLRYERIVARASETDKVNYATFIENENREMTTIDPNKQNLSACMKMADFTLTNNGTFEDLYQQIDQALELI